MLVKLTTGYSTNNNNHNGYNSYDIEPGGSVLEVSEGRFGVKVKKLFLRH